MTGARWNGGHRASHEGCGHSPAAGPVGLNRPAFAQKRSPARLRAGKVNGAGECAHRGPGKARRLGKPHPAFGSGVLAAVCPRRSPELERRMRQAQFGKFDRI